MQVLRTKRMKNLNNKATQKRRLFQEHSITFVEMK